MIPHSTPASNTVDALSMDHVPHRLDDHTPVAQHTITVPPVAEIDWQHVTVVDEGRPAGNVGQCHPFPAGISCNAALVDVPVRAMHGQMVVRSAGTRSTIGNRSCALASSGVVGATGICSTVAVCPVMRCVSFTNTPLPNSSAS